MRLDNTEVLLESEGVVIKAVSNVHDIFSVEASSDALGPSSGDPSDQAYVLFAYDLFYCSALVNVTDFSISVC